jgi:hypothetical protein
MAIILLVNESKGIDGVKVNMVEQRLPLNFQLLLKLDLSLQKCQEPVMMRLVSGCEFPIFAELPHNLFLQLPSHAEFNLIAKSLWHTEHRI